MASEGTFPGKTRRFLNGCSGGFRSAAAEHVRYLHLCCGRVGLPLAVKLPSLMLYSLFWLWL